MVASIDLQTDIIFGGNNRVKIYKFTDYRERIVIGRNLGSPFADNILGQPFNVFFPTSAYFMNGNT